MLKLIKISFLTCFVSAISLWGGAQNLVVNPSFEDTVFCPWAESQMPLSWMLFGNSADYYNSCSSALNVPNTPTGYHPANSGVGMIGLFTYVNPSSSGWPDYREFVGVPLISSLTIGQKYYLSFFINFSLRYPIGLNTNAIGADKLGMKFSTVQYSENNPPILNNTAHLYTDSIYIDTAQWVKISGSFIADSAYNYLMLGNFFDEAHTDTLYLDGLNDWSFESYYFIDDICVTTDSLYNETWVGLEEWGGGNYSNAFSVLPNPASSFVTIHSDLQNAFDIEVYNTVGKLLHAEQNITANNLQLDINAYNNGLLFIKITSQNNQFTYKLLKQ
jgi:hypothetical protein